MKTYDNIIRHAYLATLHQWWDFASLHTMKRRQVTGPRPCHLQHLFSATSMDLLFGTKKKPMAWVLGDNLNDGFPPPPVLAILWSSHDVPGCALILLRASRVP